MRSFTRWLVLLALVGSCVVSLASEAGAEDIKGSCRLNGHFRSCIYGPFWVKPGANNFTDMVPAPKQPGWIRWAQATLLDKDKKPIAGHFAHLHHASWSVPSERQTICNNISEVVYITGKEYTAMNYPQGHALYWGSEGDSWYMDAMLHGMHAGMTVKTYVRLNYRFVPASEKTFTELHNNWVPVTGCSASRVTWDINKGDGVDGRTRKSFTFTMPQTGRFVWGTGHVHDGGIRMTFKNLTKGATIFISDARYADGRWELTGTSNFSSAEGVHVDAGDELKVTAVYNSTNSWKEVMGNLRASFVPDPAP